MDVEGGIGGSLVGGETHMDLQGDRREKSEEPVWWKDKYCLE